MTAIPIVEVDIVAVSVDPPRVELAWDNDGETLRLPFGLDLDRARAMGACLGSRMRLEVTSARAAVRGESVPAINANDVPDEYQEHPISEQAAPHSTSKKRKTSRTNAPAQRLKLSEDENERAIGLVKIAVERLGTRKLLAAELGVTATSVGHWIKHHRTFPGARVPDLERIVADALGCDPGGPCDGMVRVFQRAAPSAAPKIKLPALKDCKTSVQALAVRAIGKRGLPEVAKRLEVGTADALAVALGEIGHVGEAANVLRELLAEEHLDPIPPKTAEQAAWGAR